MMTRYFQRTIALTTSSRR